MTPPNDMPADTELRELNNLLGRLVSVAKKDAVDNEAIKFRKNNIIEWFKQRDAAIRFDEATKCYRLANEYRKESPIAIKNMRLDVLRRESDLGRPKGEEANQ